MDKKKLLDLLLLQLRETLNVLIDSAEDAKQSATNEESKAENKYDTRGLEASYLAGAQAKRAEELKYTIGILEKLELRSFGPESVIQVTALVKVLVDGEVEKHFLLLPHAGGHKINLNGVEVFTVTSDSPVGKNIIGKKVDDYFELQTKANVFEYEIVDIS